ncbi:unnamed protein product [Polarella glacialis]|uniref:Uncharacterized protein n=1 Tax=Polarella glacialis TaxID=89957 RepID=A0A813H1J9_POLGL|nr:unnamed protein product [Polarella glacialis]|mmetsp:Transcript_33685/g.54141  ORF Transcript_33685/g.54141 Transcript_33685/m.54141 type:complete len:152 (-) Transcript_33685:88-543(-)
MMRACIALACAMGVGAQEWTDTPLLSSLWEATKNADQDSLDRLLDSSEYAATSRATDGRGLAWWAFEFQSTYALGAILAYGGDPLSSSEDESGQAASAMCDASSSCDKAELMEKSKAMVEDIKKRKEDRAAEREKETFDDDDDEELGEDEF